MASDRPVLVHIMASVAGALRGIRQCDGYHFDVEPTAISLNALDHSKLYTGVNLHSPMFLVELAGTRRGQIGMGDIILEVAVLHLSAAVNVSRLAGIDRAVAQEHLILDIEKALVQDVTRCELAAQTRIVEARPAVMADRIVVELTVECPLFPRRRGATVERDCACFSCFV